MTMITPSYLGETIEYSSLHACRSTLEDPTATTFALVPYRTPVTWTGSVSPAGFHVAAGLAYVADAAADSLHVLMVEPTAVRPAANWQMSRTWQSIAPTHNPQYSKSDVTVGGDGGVKFSYSAAPGGSWLGIPGVATVWLDFTTTATEDARLTLDVAFTGLHGWGFLDSRSRVISVLHNGQVVQVLAGTRTGYFDDFFNDVVLNVSAGESYGIRVSANNWTNSTTLYGTVTITPGNPPGAATLQAGLIDVAAAGLTGVTLSPDGKFAYAVNPTAGAVVALAVGADGAMTPVNAIADHTVLNGTLIAGLTGASTVVLDPNYNSLYVLSPSAGSLSVFARDPQTGALTFRQRVDLGAQSTGLTVAPSGATVYTSGPAGLSTWTRQSDGTLGTTPVVRTVDGASDWVIRAATAEAATPQAAAWSNALTYVLNRGSPAPTTAITDVPSGVKLDYSAAAGGWGVGTSTVQYDFTTVATAAASLTLDLHYTAFHGWTTLAWGLSVIRNGVVVQSLPLGSDVSKDLSFSGLTLDVAPGDRYGVRVIAGNYNADTGVTGEVTLTARQQELVVTSDSLGKARVLGPSAASLTVKSETAGIGHTSDLALSPDGQSLFLTDPVAGALRILQRDANAAGHPFVLQQTFQEGVSGLRGMRNPTGVALSNAGDFVYVTAKDGDALVAFRRNAATGKFELAQILRNGAGTTMGLKAPDSLAVDPVTGRIYVGSLAGVGQSTGGIATINVATGPAGAARASFAYSLVGIEHLALTTGDGNDTVHLVSAAPGVLDTTLRTGGADDVIVLAQFAGATTVYAGSGADTLDIRQGAPGAVLNVYGEGDADYLTLAGAATGSTTTIDGGDGADVIRVSGAGLAADVSVSGGDPSTQSGDTLLFDAGFGAMADQPAAGVVRTAWPEFMDCFGSSLANGGDGLTLHGPTSQFINGTRVKFVQMKSEALPSASPALAWNATYYVRQVAGVSGDYTYTLYATEQQAENGGPAGLMAINADASGLTAVILSATAAPVNYTGIEALEEIALPIPDAGTYAWISEGQGITLDASSTAPAAGRTVAYSWDIDGDGVFGDCTGATAAFTWDDLVAFGLGDDGAHVVWVRVTDVSDPVGDAARDSLIGQSVDDAATITILNTPPTLSLTGVSAVAVGQTYTVGFTASGDPGADTVSQWTIAWGDGTTQTFGSEVSQATHPYLTTGNYTVTVTATDEDGSYPASRPLAVNAPAPAITTVATASALTIREGDGVTFLATAAGTPQSFAWDLDHDGLYDDAVGPAPTLTWADLISLGLGDNGAYPVAVRVTYADCGATSVHTSSATATLTITNAAPTASFATSAQALGLAIFEGGSATVSFSDAHDSAPADEAGGLRYAFDFGNDGSFEIANSSNPVAAVPAAFLRNNGVLYIRGTVTDKDGGASTYLTSISVRNVAPTVALAAVAAVAEGQVATLGGVIADPGALDRFSVTVDWGDGTVLTYPGLAAGAFSYSHPYANNPAASAAGRYTPRVTVDDGDGGVGSAQTTAAVANLAPHLGGLLLTPTLTEGQAASLTGTVTDPGILDRHSLTVDWGDGSVAQTVTLDVGTTAFNLSHPYLDDGSYPVSVAVSDEDGGADQPATSLQVAVSNAPPALANLPTTLAIDEGDTATLSGQIVDSGARDRFTLVVNWGDSSPAETFNYPAGTTTFSQAHRYANDPAGLASDDYPVSLTLADNGGGVTTASTTIAVRNLAPTLDASFGDQTTTAVVNEGGTVTVAGTARDPGLKDTLAVTIHWGDGASTTLASWTLVGFLTETEGNDGLPSANALTPRWIHGDSGELAVQVSGEIALGGDVDCYRFEALAGDALHVEFPNPGGAGGALAVWLLDSAGNPVALAAADADGLRTVLDYAAPAAGSYYLKVAATAPDQGGAYTLTTTLTGPSASLPGDQVMSNSDFGDGRRSFAATHQYPVDPSGLPSGDYQISVSVTDGDGGSASEALGVVVAPTSQVAPLPAIATTRAVAVSWAGRDAGGAGSGIADYDVYVSDSGGAYAPWLTHTTATSGVFSGQHGHTYGFYTVARDHAGHTEAAPANPDALTQVIAPIEGRYLFYNSSAAGATPAAAGPNDTPALAPDKQALLPGQTATSANYSSFSRGLNGLVIDVVGLAHPEQVSATDFLFRVGNSASATDWPALTVAPTITVQPGGGANGSDRLVLTFPDGTIANQWLEVTVRSDAHGGHAGLAADDVFYFGNLVGDLTGDLVVDAADRSVLAAHYRNAGTLAQGDLDLSGKVNIVDLAILTQAQGQTLATLAPTAPPPPAPATPAPTVDVAAPDSVPVAPVAPTPAMAPPAQPLPAAPTPAPTPSTPEVGAAPSTGADPVAIPIPAPVVAAVTPAVISSALADPAPAVTPTTPAPEAAPSTGDGVPANRDEPSAVPPPPSSPDREDVLARAPRWGDTPSPARLGGPVVQPPPLAANAPLFLPRPSGTPYPVWAGGLGTGREMPIAPESYDLLLQPFAVAEPTQAPGIPPEWPNRHHLRSHVSMRS